MAEEVTGILTEDQLQRLIEAEEWYSGEGESESEAEEVSEEQDKQQQHCWQPSEKTQWSILLWRASKYEDDPFFMAASVENQPGMDVETLLRQIITITEGTDFGESEQLGTAAVPESTQQSSTDDTSTAVPESTQQSSTDDTSTAVPESTQQSSTDDTSAAVPESTQQSSTDDTSATESQHQSNEQLKDGVRTPDGSHDPVAIETQESPGQAPEENSSANASSAPPRAAEPVFDDGTVQPERPKYYYIAHEIMTTERTYVQSLRLLEKVFHGAVRTAQLTGKLILPENGRREVFMNLGELYALNFDLLKELEDRIEHWDSNPIIADAIAKRAPFFKLYSMYSSRFDDAQVAYCKWLKSSKPFAELVRTIETSRLCKGLPISSYMLCPIQRIPRYRLLLEDYLKHLPEDHPDMEHTKAALAAISAAAVHMNDRIKDLENQAQVVKIQKTFAGRENIVAPGRRYLGRGPVYFVPGTKGTRWKKQRVFFLFSDVLLITRLTRHGRYKIWQKMSLQDLLVSLVQSPLLQNAFCIAEKGMTKPLRFCTKTSDERNKWIKELHKAITDEHSRRQSFSTVSKYSRFLNDPETHSSILAVLNDPAFELRQPSWVRRSIRVKHLTTPTATPTGGREEVDWGEFEVEMEFVSQEEEGTQARALRLGMDNTLSSYMNQMAVDKDVWRKRWFVLTSRALICYESHHRDEPSGALLFVGYQVSIPDPADEISRPNVIKLSHPGKRPYFFQLPSSYDFERWYVVLKELLAAEINSLEA